MALARHHAADPAGRAGVPVRRRAARVCYGTQNVQKTHIARLKFPAPATMETWVTDPAATQCSWSSPSRQSRWPAS